MDRYFNTSVLKQTWDVGVGYNFEQLKIEVDDFGPYRVFINWVDALFVVNTILSRVSCP